tara:strand:+ start:429 stop:716 length:288 start_codon:yes stop_codon:yes gene_type:complete
MICSTRSRDKFVKEGLSPITAKYKATYLYCYLADEIRKIQSRLNKDPYNELNQEYLQILKKNKQTLLEEKNEDKVNAILDKLYSNLYYGFYGWEK